MRIKMLVLFPFVCLVVLFKIQPEGHIWWNSLYIIYSAFLIISSCISLSVENVRKGIYHNAKKCSYSEYLIIPQTAMLIMMVGIVMWLFSITHPSVGTLVITSTICVYLLQVEIHRYVRHYNEPE